jgi:PAS domain S-box-containing protein
LLPSTLRLEKIMPIARIRIKQKNACRRTRWDKEIQQSRARLSDILEHINDGFLAVNYHWQITYGNRCAALNSKYEQDELSGRNLWEVFPELVNTPLEADYRKAMAQRVFRNREIQWGSANTWYDVRIFPSSEGISIYWADITERKLAEDNLHRINAQLENRVAVRTEELARESFELLKAMEKLHQRERMLMEQNRHAAMGEMIGNIAHQWRQPLNSLALLLQRMPLFFETGRFDRPFLEESVNRAMDLINHMSQTIDDFRNFSRPEKCRTTFRLAEVVAKAQALVEASFKDQGITVEIITTDDPLVDGYPNEYSQIILNILINARDAFLQRRDIDPRIIIRLGVDGDKTVVTITDNAGGIPDKIMPNIFDPYFTTKAPDKGTGIGLYMAKTIIEKNMNGLLTARNTGEGAEFRIEV